MNTADIKFMKTAISLAEKGRGYTEPNPLVGAVVVRDGEIISTGYHEAYGKAHAERAALLDKECGEATLYVTLEPCIHFGKTPPCADLIIEKKISRVVVASLDPNPIMAGKGIDKLRDAGIKVETGCLEAEALELNRHYMTWISKKRPYVLLKAGVSVDGKLTDLTGNPGWITSEELRDISGSMRGEYSAILVGSRTLKTDNPRLTVRDPLWKNKRMWRIVLDSGNSLDGNYRFFEEQDRFPSIVFSRKGTESAGKKCNHHYFVDSDSEGLNLECVLKELHKLGVASLMVEGGGSVIDSFLKRGIYDEVAVFTSPRLLGGKDAVELHRSGTLIKYAEELKEWDVTSLESGYIFRGYR